MGEWVGSGFWLLMVRGCKLLVACRCFLLLCNARSCLMPYFLSYLLLSLVSVCCVLPSYGRRSTRSVCLGEVGRHVAFYMIRGLYISLCLVQHATKLH